MPDRNHNDVDELDPNQLHKILFSCQKQINNHMIWDFDVYDKLFDMGLQETNAWQDNYQALHSNVLVNLWQI